MADIHHLITLGIGTPADIKHFTLVGLSPTGPVADIVPVTIERTVFLGSTEIFGDSVLASALERTVFLPASEIFGDSVLASAVERPSLMATIVQRDVEW